MAGIAMLGAGIFAQDEYLPALRKSTEFKLKAVYSRSQKSSDAFATKCDFLSSAPEVYYDSPSAPGKSLEDLLARPDIAAVICALPIVAQPAIVKKALQAGKAVLSEKPIAKDVATASELVQWHASLANSPVWGVAENFRYVPTVQYAADKLKEMGGKVVTFRLKVGAFMNPDNKYFHTEWRKTPEYQGGFLLDGGVHGIAGVRYLLDAAGHNISQVACFSALTQEFLPPVDSLLATAKTDKGAVGTLTLAFGNEFDATGWAVEVITTEGAVSWGDKGVTVTKRGNGEPVVERHDVPADASVGPEVEALAKGIKSGAVDPRQSSVEALKDLELLQALLESGEAGGATKSLSQ